MASENPRREGEAAGDPLHQLDLHPREAILTWCREAAPNPWYPSVFSQNSGIPRERLDPFLDELRLGGLIHLTEWVPGRGQGYSLTPAGVEVVENPRLLERLRTDGVPQKPAPAWVERPRPQVNAETWERGEGVREALLAPFVPLVTYTLVAINVLFFLAGMALAVHYQVPLNRFFMEGNLDIVLWTGGIFGPPIAAGEWWRLITSCFVHIGLLHLAMNMYALFVLGPITERLFGHWRYLLLYLIAGFGGSCFAALIQPMGITAGASGAICGLLGAMLAWTFLNQRHLPPRLYSSWMRSILINTVLIIIISSIPGVSWAGHLGGGIFGLLAAALLNMNRFRTGWVRWVALVGTLLLPVASYGLLYQAPLYSQTWKKLRHDAQLFEDLQKAPKEDPNQRKEELRVMNKEVLPEVWKVFRESRAEATEKQARSLTQQAPGKRDKEQVRKTLTALAWARDRLPEARTRLNHAGPYKTPQIEAVRKILLESVETYFRLFGLYQECLQQEDKWTDQENQTLKAEQERLDKIQQIQRQLFDQKR